MRPDVAEPPAARLQEWLDLFAGLTDEEVNDLESAILQRERSPGTVI